MSKIFKVHDKAVVVVLNKAEANALLYHSEQSCVYKSQHIKRAQEKIRVALEDK